MPLLNSAYSAIRRTQLARPLGKYGMPYTPGPRPTPEEDTEQNDYSLPEGPEIQAGIDVPPSMTEPPEPIRAPIPPRQPTAIEQLRGLKPPEEPKRNWWQKAASLAAGALAGYNNADERVRPVDPRAVQAGVAELTMPGEMRRVRDYGRQRAELERQAGLEEKMAEQTRRTTLSEAQTEAARARQRASERQMKHYEWQERNPPPLKPMIVPPAGAVFDPNTGKPVFTNPPRPSNPQRPLTKSYEDQKSGTTTTVFYDTQGNEINRTTERTPRRPPASEVEKPLLRKESSAIENAKTLALNQLSAKTDALLRAADDKDQKQRIIEDEATEAQSIQQAYESRLAERTGEPITTPFDMASHVRQRRQQIEAGRQPPPEGKPLTDKQKAADYLRRANGDKERARAMARADGWTF